MIPKMMFFTKGVGVHKNRLQAFELALRMAGVARFNLVSVSSIFPPHCKIVGVKRGLQYLQPGQIVHTVMARADTNEPNRLIAAAVGLAVPKDRKHYGYLSEHHAFGETRRKAADFAEDLAATMLATTMGIEFDPEAAWDERKKLYNVRGGREFISRSVVQSAEGNKDGLWTVVVAMAVFITDPSLKAE